MLIWIFIALLIPTIILGAHFLLRSKIAKTSYVLNILVAISTGILVAITFFEFLPHTFSNKNYSNSIIVLIGMLTFYIFDHYITPRLKFFNSAPSCENSGCNTHDPAQVLSKQSACSSISCLVVCAFFDGVELSASQWLDSNISLTMAIAIFIHLAPSGALAASLSLAGKLGNPFAFKSSLVISISLLLGIALSYFLNFTDSFQNLLLPFASGILIYNILVHLVPATLKIKSGILWTIITTAITAFFIHQH